MYSVLTSPVLSALHVSPQLFLIPVLEYSSYFHFTVEEAETQKFCNVA